MAVGRREVTTFAEVRLWGSTIGVASLEDGADAAAFEYTPAFVASGIEVSPLRMPLARTVYAFPALPRQTFHGLPGLLAEPITLHTANELSGLAR